MDFDAPIFKRLARNDTDEAPGHQAGVVVPKELEKFFPILSDNPTSMTPTADRLITAELFVNGGYVESVRTRYQHQTWGGTRSAERRITGNLSGIRSKASGGDILVIERAFDRDDYFRLSLIIKDTPLFREINSKVAGRRWGAVTTTQMPLTDADLVAAEREQDGREANPLRLFDLESRRVEIRRTQVARSKVFQRRILEIYARTCCICGEGLASLGGLSEIQAAHIVPRNLMGTDDARNGLCLCARHHWAFDHGLFGVSAERQVEVHQRAAAMPENKPLLIYQGRSLREAGEMPFRAAAEALAWHLANVVYRDPPM